MFLYLYSFACQDAPSLSKQPVKMPHLLAGSYFFLFMLIMICLPRYPHLYGKQSVKMPHLLAGSCHIHFVVHIDLVPNPPSFGKHLVKMPHYLEGSSLVDNDLGKIPCLIVIFICIARPTHTEFTSIKFS